MTTTHKAAALARDMRHVADDVEQLLGEAGSSGSAALKQWRGRLDDVMGQARKRYDALDSDVRNSARHAVDATNEYVHHSPWQAIGVGLLVGLAAGLLIMRRW